MSEETELVISCHDLMQKSINFNNIAMAFVKGRVSKIHLCYMSKNEAIYLLKNVILL